MAGCCGRCLWAGGALAAVVLATYLALSPADEFVHHADGMADFKPEALSEPEYPVPVRTIGALLGLLPPSAYASLEVADLLAEARSRAGHGDFGPEAAWRPGLQRWLAALQQQPHLWPVGRFTAKELTVSLLVFRLQLEHAIKEHPEILDEEIRAPIILTGPPRSGSTHLHNLMDATGLFRASKYFENVELLDTPGRHQRASIAASVYHMLRPSISLLHRLEANSTHEEIHFEALGFSSVLLVAVITDNAFMNEWIDGDMEPPMRELKRTLQFLQFQDAQRGRPRRRWVLKTPGHIFRLPVLARVFPGAKFVVTNREPLSVARSIGYLQCYMNGITVSRVDPRAVSLAWAHWLARGLERLMDALDSGAVEPASVLHISSAEYFADNLGTMERVLAFVGEAGDPAVRGRLQAYIEAHPRRGGTKIRYALETLGTSDAEVEEAHHAVFTRYRQRFGLDTTP